MPQNLLIFPSYELLQYSGEKKRFKKKSVGMIAVKEKY